MENLDLITIKEPKSIVSESYRTLRTNIQFSSFDEKIKTIVITSTGPGEGKSIISSNLSVVLAESDKKTILIDCDQRKPKLHKLFALSNEYGLSNLLAEEVEFNQVINHTEINNLDVLTSGIRPPNPSELLDSSKMQQLLENLKKEYDYIIIDTPPVVMVTDAQILAQHSDGCLLVISSGEADRNSAQKAKELLRKVNAKILGVVLNKMDINAKGYYSYYHYEHGEDKWRQHNKSKKRLKGIFKKHTVDF